MYRHFLVKIPEINHKYRIILSLLDIWENDVIDLFQCFSPSTEEEKMRRIMAAERRGGDGRGRLIWLDQTILTPREHQTPHRQVS